MWNYVHAEDVIFSYWFFRNKLGYQPCFTNLFYSYSPVPSCQDICLPFPKQNQLDWCLVLRCPCTVIWLCSAHGSTNYVHSHSWEPHSFHHSPRIVMLLCCTFASWLYTPFEHCSKSSLWLPEMYENILKLCFIIYLTAVVLKGCCCGIQFKWHLWVCVFQTNSLNWVSEVNYLVNLL